MDDFINKKQQVSEYQQDEKDEMEHAKKQERVHMAQKYIDISSTFSSSLFSDDSLETSSDESSDWGASKKSTKPMTSPNKPSTFLAKHKSDNEEKPLK